MRITVELLKHDLAAVVVYPSWWRWLLFGASTREFFVERVRSINGGWTWLDDKTGRPVDAAVQTAIEDEVMLTAVRGAAGVPAAERMRCSTCERERVVTITQMVRIGKRRVVWTLCVPCWRAERNQERA